MAPTDQLETLDVDLDRPRRLRLTPDALIQLSRAFPTERPHQLFFRHLLDVQHAPDGTPRFLAANLWALQLCLWAACLYDDPDLTVPQAGDVITSVIQSGRLSFDDLAAIVWAAGYVGGLIVREEPEKNEEGEAATTH